MPTRVLVAMSGGVDSAVAALLLRQQGHQVVGATMKLFDNQQAGVPIESGCCSLADVSDARRTAARLGCDHHTFGFTEPFGREVIGRFAEGYQQGETPNPCIDCNRFIKFPLLLRRADILAADQIATGHYARVERDGQTGRYLLRRAADREKDQSYVLYAITQEQLARTRFPLGEITKEQVRSLAQTHNLPVAQKKESQDICFVPGGDYAAFLTGVMGLTPRPGPVVDQGGAVLAEHQGIHRFTIGQRRGLPVSLGCKTYVTAIDPASATVTVGGAEDLHTHSFMVGELNWIALEGLDKPLDALVQTRYRQRPAAARLHPLPDGGVRVVLREPQRAVTPGQAAVFYRQDLVLGGGTIRPMV